jgi:predicted RNA-binding protein (virulence factor B family)
MVKIGKVNNLKIVKKVEFGLYLDGGELGEILLPKKYINDDVDIDDFIDGFIYFDSEDRIIATTKIPFAQVDEYAFLTVVDISRIGAFLDWGLEKDLFVPFREQNEKMIRGKSYVVRIYFDDMSNRIAASSKIERFLYLKPVELEENQPVNMLISHQTDLGFKVIVDNKYPGLLFKNDIFQTVKIGQSIKGYIKKIRLDGKIDLSIHPSGYGKIDDLSQKILNILKSNNDYISVTDESKPELIYQLFGMSKKNFKKSIGTLYKQRIISLEEEGIRLIKK